MVRAAILGLILVVATCSVLLLQEKPCVLLMGKRINMRQLINANYLSSTMLQLTGLNEE